ncbi:MAG TPA: hypothetical protein VF906_05925 [Candidatus Bathyarchaeia archaeon]
MSFCSSVNLRKTRQRLETSARGPPNKRSSVEKSMFAQGTEVGNVGISKLTSARVFQLPIPPAIKPSMEDAFRSGLSSSQLDLGSNE